MWLSRLLFGSIRMIVLHSRQRRYEFTVLPRLDSYLPTYTLLKITFQVWLLKIFCDLLALGYGFRI